MENKYGVVKTVTFDRGCFRPGDIVELSYHYESGHTDTVKGILKTVELEELTVLSVNRFGVPFEKVVRIENYINGEITIGGEFM